MSVRAGGGPDGALAPNTPSPGVSRFHRFERRPHCLIIDGDDRYFVYEPPGEASFVVSSRCPHRGGPLNLGHHDEASGRLICPWHRMEWTPASLRRRALPAFSIGRTWTVRLPAPSRATSVVVMYAGPVTCELPRSAAVPGGRG